MSGLTCWIDSATQPGRGIKYPHYNGSKGPSYGGNRFPQPCFARAWRNADRNGNGNAYHPQELNLKRPQEHLTYGFNYGGRVLPRQNYTDWREPYCRRSGNTIVGHAESQFNARDRQWDRPMWKTLPRRPWTPPQSNYRKPYVEDYYGSD